MTTGRKREGGPLRGAMTALVTPFDDGGDVDHGALRDLVAWQIESGIHGLVPCGTTGEGATLDAGEHAAVIETVASEAGGRIPVIAGCGSNDTRRTVDAARRAVNSGADALLVVSPYYNKPNRSGMLKHYEKVASAGGRPVVVYNVPGRTGQNLGSELILELSRLEGVDAVKEASGNLDQIASILRDAPSGFSVLSGDDMLALPTVALGADGVISVVANEAPAQMARLVEAALSGEMEAARKIHYSLLELMRVNFVETNPVPVKVGMDLLRRCKPDVRSPLGAAEGSTITLVAKALGDCGLLEGR